MKLMFKFSGFYLDKDILYGDWGRGAGYAASIFFVSSNKQYKLHCSILKISITSGWYL